MKHEASQATLYEQIEIFLEKAVELALVTRRDLIYLRNRIYLALDLGAPQQFPAVPPGMTAARSLVGMTEDMCTALDERQRARLGETREQVETRLVDLLLPLPSSVEEKFQRLRQEQGIRAAMDWYYQFSRNTNYIRTEDIAKNQSWQSRTSFGHVEITINLSKPEKDPLEIARLKQVRPKNTEYPKCPLCIENEGYAGSGSQAARHNHRLIEVELGGRSWFFQFSPYLYYPEHSIVIDPVHCDMVINEKAFNNLFEFVEWAPHYIIGSNSDIPIVGGSILCHDHYQAGNHVFPIEKAAVRNRYSLPDFAGVEISHLAWPLTTLQLTGSRGDLLKLIAMVMERWYCYENHRLDIVARDAGGNRHNGITPIVRRLGADRYRVYLLLRNNRTTGEHPEGIFHPHRHLHHIKKENIGLIEAMGLAILPGRLATELAGLEELLLLNDKETALRKASSDESLARHGEWLADLYGRYGSFQQETIGEVIRDEVASKFVQVLECSGVFKNTAEGGAAMDEFVASLG